MRARCGLCTSARRSSRSRRLTALIDSRHTRRRGRVAAGSAEGSRTAASADADEDRRGRPRHPRPAAGAAQGSGAVPRGWPRSSPISASSPPTVGSLPDALLAVPPSGMINVHGVAPSRLPRRRARPSRGDRRRHGNGRDDHARHPRARRGADVRHARDARSVPTRRAREVERRRWRRSGRSCCSTSSSSRGRDGRRRRRRTIRGRPTRPR